jgi:hypothetical protein
VSKLRLAVGILAAVAFLAAGMAVVVARQQDRRDRRPAAGVEYTVAAATAAEAAPGRVMLPVRRGTMGPFPETLTLVAVGGLLLGLAAAVRRTT